MPKRILFIAHLIAFSLTIHLVFFTMLFLFQSSEKLYSEKRFSDLTICFSSSIQAEPSLFAINQDVRADKQTEKIVMEPRSQLAHEEPIKMKKKEIEENVRKPSMPEKKVEQKKNVKQASVEPKKQKPNGQQTSIKEKTLQKKEKQKNNKPTQKLMHAIAARETKIQDVEMPTLLKELIAKQWVPPAGVCKDLSCTIKVIINQYGMVKDLIVEKSSEVIAYDIAAKHALTFLSFPASYYGKEMSITFNQ